MGSVPPLDQADYRDLVARALREDIGEGDVTTESIVAPDQRARGVLTAKATCVVAGLDVALEVFRQMDPSVEVRLAHGDGERLTAGSEIGTITGSARGLLAAERTALNFLQRLSGIATLTRSFVAAAGGRITILDTRKTTPTLRALEKYAVAVGGATNHRRGLFDAVLIKDNHVRLAGGVSEAVSRARAARPGARLEVEAQSLAEVDAALDAGADALLADNLSLSEIRETVVRARGKATVEISGGVTLDRLDELAATGADTVSIGALTHSAPAADISLEIEPL